VSLHASAVETLTSWQAPDPAQDTLRHAVLSFLAARPDACLRECVPGHITASALVLDHTGTRALLTLHPRFGRWLQLGGHCEDTDADIVAAALREAAEESGIGDLRIDPVLAAPNAEIACSDESLDLRWWPLDALPEDCDFGLTQLADAARR
jgi:8-oxo-dGTP pyrophosphatase MutT (NUDIX family)